MSLGRNATYNLLGQLAPLVVSLTTVPVYLHLVGVERYGVLAIAWMLLGYFGLFDLGLTRATLHRIASLRDASPADRARTFWTAATMAAALATIGAVLLYAGGYWYFSGPFEVTPALRREALQALPVMALVLPFAILSGVLNGSLQGRERFLDMNAITVATAVTAQLVPVFVAWAFGPRLVLLVGSSLLVQAAAMTVSWTRCRRYVFERQPYDATRREAKELLRFGGWITVSATVGPLMTLTDRFVIGGVVNAAAVTTYAVPAQLAQRASIIPYSLSTALFPKLSAEPDQRLATDLCRVATRTSSAIMTPLVMLGICAMGPFLTLWLHGALAPEAVTIGQVLLLGWWVNGLAINPFTLLQANGRPRVPALLQLAELPCYIVLLWLLTARFGPVGAAITFSIRCAADTLALNLLAYGQRQDLAVYLAPAVLLVGAVPLIGSLSLDGAAIGVAVALIATSAAWSLLILPAHLRQGLTTSLLQRLRSTHA